MRLLVVPICLVAALLCGCSVLDPFEPETEPPVAGLQVRITEGTGATKQYHGAVQIRDPGTIQLRSLVADGDAVEYSIPRGPAEPLKLVAMRADTDAPIASVLIGSANGEPIVARRLFSFDPGYVAVEDDSDASRLVLRASTPRQLNTAQGQTTFSFKVDVGPAGTGGG